MADSCARGAVVGVVLIRVFLRAGMEWADIVGGIKGAKEDMPTICANCIHFYNRQDGPRTGVWYNQFCKAAPREKTIDPVSGEEGFLACNDLGREYVTDEPYMNCRDINKGNCPKFEPKSGAEWPADIEV